MKTLRIFVSTSDDLGDVRLAVLDLLAQLNRFFKTRGIELVPTRPGDGPAGGDLAWALYGKNFGALPEEEFDRAYEAFKEKNTPKILVFFQEPAEGVAEALQAFKDTFGDRYGHFFCRFETVDSVKFQLTVQSLSMLPRKQQEEAIKLENSSIFVGDNKIADLNNLPFAALNSKRNALLEEIESGEKRLAECLAKQAEMPSSEDAMEAVESVEASLRLARDELSRHETILFSAALAFARQQSSHMDESVRRAMELFNQGRIRDANRVLDLDYLVSKAERDIESYATAKSGSMSDIEALLAKASIVEGDYSLSEEQRFMQMDKAYSIAIRIAEIMEDRVTQYDIIGKRATLLQDHGDYQEAETLFLAVLAYEKELVGEAVDDPLEEGVVFALENLHRLYIQTGDNGKALECINEAIARTRRLSTTIPDAVSLLARLLSWLTDLLNQSGNKEEADQARQEALDLLLPLAEQQPDECCFWIASILMDMAREENEAGLADSAIDKLRKAMAYLRGDDGRIRDGEEDTVAMCLEQEADLLQQEGVNRSDQALRSAEEALSLRRTIFGKENSPGNEDSLADSICRCANLYAKNGDAEKAVPLYEEAISRFRSLAASVANGNPAGANASLADSLEDFALLYEDEGEFEKAEQKCEEALVVWRALDNKGQDEGNRARLAICLSLLADLHLQHLNAPVAALQEYGEAVKLYRQLADDNPDEYEPGLADVCFSYAEVLQSQNRMDEAGENLAQALSLRKKLAESNPGEFAPVVEVLNKMAVFSLKCNRLEEAEARFSEVLELVRKTAGTDSDKFEPFKLSALAGLSSLHLQMGRISEAATEANEGLVLARKCEAHAPGSFDNVIRLLEKSLSVIRSQNNDEVAGVGMVKDMLGAVKGV